MHSKYSSDEVLNLLKQLDVKSNSIEQVKKILDRYEYRKIISSLIVPKGSIILRARVHNDKEIFKTVGELTYPQKEYCTKNQRANLKGHPIFYCCMQVPGGGKIYDALAGMLFETSDSVRENQINVNEKKLITYSAWEVKEEFKVFYFPFKKAAYINCPEEISMLNQEYCQKYCNQFNQDILNDPLLEFLVNKISSVSKGEDSYYIIANVIHYILANDKYFGGIMYLSTRMNGYIVNLALTPHTVDNSLMQKGVNLYGFQKYSGDMSLEPLFDGILDGENIKYERTKYAKKIWDAAHI